jgi:carbon-monoxide dehydrogenase large subunit
MEGRRQPTKFLEFNVREEGSMKEFKVIGEPVTRKDALEKVTGAAIFGADFKLPNQLWARFYRSPIPHARILTIDTSKAQKVLGVKGIVTGADVPYRHGTSVIQDQPFLAIDRVRYVGEPVVGVIAEGVESADEAVDQIRVEFEPLPAVLDVFSALEYGAPLVHEELMEYTRTGAVNPVERTNICNHFKLRKGNIEEGFQKSDVIVEDTYSVPMIQHAPLETHAATAKLDPDGSITVWSSTQSPFYIRGELARALGIPMSRLRVICLRVGGGFGCKHEMRIEHLAIAMALKANFRPVKVVLTREEEFVSTLVRMPVHVKIKTGAKKDGTLLAQEVTIHWDTGAYSGWGPLVTRNAGCAASGPYVVPNIQVDSFCIYTNKPLGGAYRGLGVPEVAWAHESNLDMVAHQLGIDPLEIRLRNALEEGSISAMGESALNVGLKESLLKAAEGIDWKNRSPGKARGKGIACMYKMTGTPTSSSAVLRLNEDGTVQVLQSAVEMGQGVETAIAQIVAEELCVPYEKVRLTDVDTEFTPYERSTTSSRATFHTGNAAKAAAADAKKQLLQIVAKIWETEVTELDIINGWVVEQEGQRRCVEIGELWTTGIYSKSQFPIVGCGVFSTAEIFDPADPETSQSKRATAFWMYAAQAAEVEVDTETGRVAVLRFSAAHDVGRVINQMTCEQQIEGALVMGMGTAMFEELLLEDGRVVNPNFVDYKLPNSMDAPQEIKTFFVESLHPEGPYGAKGLGEPGLAATAAAIGNAIYNALGIRIKDLPITPDKVLKAIKEKR